MYSFKPVPTHKRPKGMTTGAILERLKEGDTVEQMLAHFGVPGGYAIIVRLRKRYEGFREKYDEIMKTRRPSQAMFNELYPHWKMMFVACLESQLPSRPKISEAVLRMNQEFKIPLKTNRVYACKKVGSPYYDEDFALEVAALGCEVMNEILEMVEDRILEEQDHKTGLNYVRAHPQSPLTGPQTVRLEVDSEHRRKIDVNVRHQIAQESQDLRERIVESTAEEITDGLPAERGEATHLRSLPKLVGAESPARQGEGEEESEEEGDLQEEVASG